MMNYMHKAEKVWNAQQSGVIFTGFYLVTLILVGLPAAMYFLSSETFPKECDIQDTFVGLCRYVYICVYVCMNVCVGYICVLLCLSYGVRYTGHICWLVLVRERCVCVCMSYPTYHHNPLYPPY